MNAFMYGFLDEMDKIASQVEKRKKPSWAPRTPSLPVPKQRQTLEGPRSRIGDLVKRLKSKIPRS